MNSLEPEHSIAIWNLNVLPTKKIMMVKISQEVTKS